MKSRRPLLASIATAAIVAGAVAIVGMPSGSSDKESRAARPTTSAPSPTQTSDEPAPEPTDTSTEATPEVTEDPQTPAGNGGAQGGSSSVTASSPNVLRGVTLDSPYDIDSTVAVIASSDSRLTVRLVVDPQAPLADYATAIDALSPHADIMVEVLDSTELASHSAAWVEQRTRSAVATFGDDVDIWEIGNELNGEWAGQSPESITAKAKVAYDVVRGAGGTTAVTFNYWSSSNCYSHDWEATLPFAQQAAGQLGNVDYVFLSIYETACEPAQHPSAGELASTLNQLGAMYPNARLGIGEVGAQGIEDGLSAQPSLSEKQRIATYYYGMHDEIAGMVGDRYVGGYFWWYFRQDAVDARGGNSLWPTLNELTDSL